jgi:hypothetical protein
MIDNQWRHGLRDFVLPPLPKEMARHGCGFHRMTFDPTIGEEVIVFFREEPPYAADLADVQPLTVLAYTGITRTPFGLVAFVVWQIAAGTAQESYVETFLNPFQFGTLKLIADAANQTHLKFIAYDLGARKVVSMVDFENTFDLDQLLFGMAMSIGHEEEGDFDQATAFIMENASVMDLVNQART